MVMISKIDPGLPYTRDLQGLCKCLLLAAPLMRKLFVGNLAFGAFLFGCFELMQRRFPELQLQSFQRS